MENGMLRENRNSSAAPTVHEGHRHDHGETPFARFADEIRAHIATDPAFGPNVESDDKTYRIPMTLAERSVLVTSAVDAISDIIENTLDLPAPWTAPGSLHVWEKTLMEIAQRVSAAIALLDINAEVE